MSLSQVRDVLPIEAQNNDNSDRPSHRICFVHQPTLFELVNKNAANNEITNILWMLLELGRMLHL